MTFDETKMYDAMEIIAHAAVLGFNDVLLTMEHKAQLRELLKAWAMEQQVLRDMRRVA